MLQSILTILSYTGRLRYPDDLGQTPAQSNCLKFAGPIIQVTCNLSSHFLSDEYSATLEEKTNQSHSNTGVCTVHWLCLP